MEESGGNGGKGSFFACYLLTSLNPRYKGCHYIGFTVNPRRRIRQHNGELTSGAWRTHRKRPWDMVLCVFGFTSQVEALQFEWAWQHPMKSLAVKEAAARIPPSVRGLKKQFYLLFTMLNCDKWSTLDLNVQFLSSKYIDYRKGCPGLPPHMGLSIAPVESLPVNLEEADSELEDMEKEAPRETSIVEDSVFGSQPTFSEEDDSDVVDERQAVDFPAPVDVDELLPIQVPASPLEAPVPVSLNCTLETSPRPKNMVGQRKTEVKATTEVSERQSSCDTYDWPSSPLPNGRGAVSSVSPFSAFLDRYSTPEPSSIVRRCLHQKSSAYTPVLSESSLPVRNLSNEGLLEDLPCTPPCKPRVVVVIPDDTPVSSSREVIDLTDSPH